MLERLSPRAWIEMNPRDAPPLRLEPQDRVGVVSRRLRVRGVSRGSWVDDVHRLETMRQATVSRLEGRRRPWTSFRATRHG